MSPFANNCRHVPLCKVIMLFSSCLSVCCPSAYLISHFGLFTFIASKTSKKTDKKKSIKSGTKIETPTLAKNFCAKMLFLQFSLLLFILGVTNASNLLDTQTQLNGKIMCKALLEYHNVYSET
jgi:hypothetical protein